MDKTKIIVVEDNIVYCEYVCNMLSREGYRNMKAYHLSTAKKHLQQATDNDIVVADLRLPDGSGIDLLCWMRKEGKMQPFIIMTDYAEVNTAVESMKLGSIDYIPKQLVEDKLVPLIRSILKERQAGQRRMPIFAREGSAFQKIMHRIRLVAATDMSGQMKTLIDRMNAMFPKDYRFRDVYLLTTAAEDDANVPTRAESGLQGWIDCFGKSDLKGHLFCGGVGGPNEIAGNAKLQEAYRLGESV